MIRKTVSMGLALVGLIAAGGHPCWAESPSATNQKAQMMQTQSDVKQKVSATKETGGMIEKSNIRQLTGKIESITNTQLRVKKGEQTHTFSVTGKTKVKLGDSKNKISDLKAGDKVMTKYVEEDGIMIARSISLKPSAVK